MYVMLNGREVAWARGVSVTWETADAWLRANRPGDPAKGRWVPTTVGWDVVLGGDLYQFSEIPGGVQ